MTATTKEIKLVVSLEGVTTANSSVWQDLVSMLSVDSGCQWKRSQRPGVMRECDVACAGTSNWRMGPAGRPERYQWGGHNILNDTLFQVSLNLQIILDASLVIRRKLQQPSNTGYYTLWQEVRVPDGYLILWLKFSHGASWLLGLSCSCDERAETCSQPLMVLLHSQHWLGVGFFSEFV